MSHSDEKLIAAVIKGMAQLEQVLRKNGAVGIGLKELLYSINRKLDTKIAKDIGKCIPIRNLVAHNATVYIDSDDVEYMLKKLTTVLSYFGEELKIKHSSVFWNNFEETAQFYESIINKHRYISRELEPLIYTRYLMPAISDGSSFYIGNRMTRYSLSLNQHTLLKIKELLEKELKECKGVMSSVLWLLKLIKKDIEQFEDPIFSRIDSFKYIAPESAKYNRGPEWGMYESLSSGYYYYYSRPFHSNSIKQERKDHSTEYGVIPKKLELEETKVRQEELYKVVEIREDRRIISDIETQKIVNGWHQERKDFLALLEEHKRKFYKMPTFDPKDFSEEEVEFLIQKYQIPRRNIRTVK